MGAIGAVRVLEVALVVHVAETVVIVTLVVPAQLAYAITVGLEVIAMVTVLIV